MKAANLLNFLLAIALVLLCAMLWREPAPTVAPTAPGAAVSEAPAPVADVSAAPATPDEWREIAPKDAVMDPAAVGVRDTMLLAAGREGDFNAMTIGWWGTGVLWKKPVVTVYVSKSRYTWEFMEKNDTFTVCAFPDEYRAGVMYLGTHSGRDGDKIGPSGLTPAFTASGAPYFAEADLVLECRRIYETELSDLAQLPEEARRLYDNGMLPHAMYVGEITSVRTRVPAP